MSPNAAGRLVDRLQPTAHCPFFIHPQILRRRPTKRPPDHDSSTGFDHISTRTACARSLSLARMRTKSLRSSDPFRGLSRTGPACAGSRGSLSCAPALPEQGSRKQQKRPERPRAGGRAKRDKADRPGTGVFGVRGSDKRIVACLRVKAVPTVMCIGEAWRRILVQFGPPSCGGDQSGRSRLNAQSIAVLIAAPRATRGQRHERPDKGRPPNGPAQERKGAV